MDSDHALHGAAARVRLETNTPLLLSPFVLADLDYLLMTRLGNDFAVALLEEVLRGTYRLEGFSAAEVMRAARVRRRYVGFGDVGLTDASLVVLAERHDTLDLLTLD